MNMDIKLDILKLDKSETYLKKEISPEDVKWVKNMKMK